MEEATIMKGDELALMTEIIRRQLGHNPSKLEINNMKKLLSVKINDFDKTRDALKAIDDVYNNENCSWYDGQYERNKDSLDNNGIFYRGNYLSKRYIFDRALDIAKGLYANGIRKGDSFSACVSNIPDLITTLLATSYIGARINIFDSSFNKEYIKKIINSCDADFIFSSDDQYGKIKDILKDTKIKKKVLLSLADHLPLKFPDYYKDIPSNLYDFENKAKKYAHDDNEVILLDDFILEGSKIDASDIKDKRSSIYDVFTITYSSGSSRPGYPKAIPHNNLSFLMMMRFHDEDMMGLPKNAKLNDIVGLAHIPPISDTNVKSVISDTLGQGSIVACEPIYGRDTFIYSLLMNRPNFCDATRSSWIEFARQVNTNKKYKNLKMPFLVLPLSVGEQLEVNERNFVDEAFKRINAGRDIFKKWKLPLLHTYLGEGGGRTESGGIVYTILQGFNEKINFFKLKKGRYGMVPTLATDAIIIDSNGNECAVNEIGELCADSACSMANNRYYFDEDNNEDFFIRDNYNRIFPRFKVYAYRNELGNIIMKGRMGSEFIVNNRKIPEFVISDIILTDKKRVLSAETINLDGIPIVDIEINPLYLKGKDKGGVVANTILDANNKCTKILPKELSSKIVFRIRDDVNKYPLTDCAKRDINCLKKEGLSNCFKPVVVDDTVVLMDAKKYYSFRDNYDGFLIEKDGVLNRFKSKVLMLRKQK